MFCQADVHCLTCLPARRDLWALLPLLLLLFVAPFTHTHMPQVFLVIAGLNIENPGLVQSGKYREGGCLISDKSCS